jgi:hypothetical protein
MRAVDPCYAKTPFSVRRFALFTLLFLILCPGSVLLFILFGEWPLGLQFASVICYTSLIVLFTFSHYRDQQRYLFTCPVVRRETPRLVYWHVAFSITLIAGETLALGLRPRLPESWLVAGSGSMPPFVAMLFGFSFCLALAQLMMNRSALQKAHSGSVLR